MKFHVIVEDRMCIKDDLGFENIPMSELPDTINAIHWDSDAGVGQVEWFTHEVEFHNVSHEIGDTGITVQDLIDRYEDTKEAVKQAEIASRSTPQEALKQARDGYLLITDWTQVADNALSQEERDAWKAWRQKLRELPNSAGGAGAYLNDEGILCGVTWPDLASNLKSKLKAPYPPHLGES